MLNKLTEIIQNPGKSLIATIGGTVTGYIPAAINDVARVSDTGADTIFQYVVWTITILVGITSLISWIQKQMTFYRKILMMKKKRIGNIENCECLNELIKEEEQL